MRAFYTAWQDSLRQYDKAALSEQEQASFTIFEYEMAEKLEMLHYPDNLSCPCSSSGVPCCKCPSWVAARAFSRSKMRRDSR